MGSGFPKFRGQDRIVSVDEKIPHSDDPCPWDFWMGFLKIGSDPVGRFTDQFKATFEGGLELLVIVASDGEFGMALARRCWFQRVSPPGPKKSAR